MKDPRFPIGRFHKPESLSPAERTACIGRIALVPEKLRAAVSGLDEQQFHTPYRDGGWTVRQVVHHLPDSHMNSFLRFKWALTEAEPTIKPYDEGAWALLKDVEDTPVETSLLLLEALHERWVILLRNLNAGEFERRLMHPEAGPMNLDQLLALYAWHGDHHIAHITQLREARGW